MNCVLAGMNFVFRRRTRCGKDGCAKFFMQFIPREERVITIEDSLEIHYRDINPGADAVELRVGEDFSYTDAIKASLRQNPKWLVLSEAKVGGGDVAARAVEYQRERLYDDPPG